MKSNIHFSSDQLLQYYSSHRQSWEELYPSEKWVFEKVFTENHDMKNILAIGAHSDDVEFGCFGTLLKHIEDY